MSNSDEHKDEGRDHDKHFSIVVNGRPKRVTEGKISFDDVVLLAYGQLKPNSAYTVTYKRGPKANPEGTMSSGDIVEIKSGMVFNVTETDKS